MSVLTAFSAGRRTTASRKETDKKPRKAFIGELYCKARGDMCLMFIYNKIEKAAEIGDWSLMNKLYGEFKLREAALN